MFAFITIGCETSSCEPPVLAVLTSLSHWPLQWCSKTRERDVFDHWNRGAIERANGAAGAEKEDSFWILRTKAKPG